MLVMNVPAPVNEWCVKKACHEIYRIAAEEDRKQGMHVICSVKCEKGVKEGVQKL
jgi:hypothetical protein